MPVNYYIFVSIALFCIGVVGVLTRRNAIVVFMCIELMLNAVNLLLVAFSKMHYAINIVKRHQCGYRRPVVCFFYYGGGSGRSKRRPGHYCNDVPEYAFGRY